MNAGKSTIMLQSSYNYNERGMDTLLFTPQFDTRYGEGKVASRIGLEASAIGFDADFSFYNCIELALQKNSNIKCVLVDEAQFLQKKQVIELANVTDDFSIPVLTYGLRTDFMGEPFEGSKYLLSLADTLIEIKTICHCGRKATMNLRVDADGKTVKEGNQVEIGGNERYVAVCRRHYRKATSENDEKNK
jgi:thymidine kinase